MSDKKDDGHGGDHGADPYIGMKKASVGILLAFIVIAGGLLSMIGSEIFNFLNGIGRAYENNKGFIHFLLGLVILFVIIAAVRGGSKKDDGHH